MACRTRRNTGKDVPDIFEKLHHMKLRDGGVSHGLNYHFYYADDTKIYIHTKQDSTLAASLLTAFVIIKLRWPIISFN